MADIVSPKKRSEMMAGIKGKNTKPEIIVRKLVHGAGYRFRLNRKDLPGKPDIVLAKHGAVIFVNGCFWHCHGNCHLFRLPKSRVDFWAEKLSGNVNRDARNKAELKDAGWRTLYIWECAVKGKAKHEPSDLISQICEFLEDVTCSDKEVRGKLNL